MSEFPKYPNFFKNYTGKDDWQCRYMSGRCSYVCRIRQGRKTRTLWAIYLVITELNCIYFKLFIHLFYYIYNGSLQHISANNNSHV
jgi:hypothetical protein